MPAISFGAAIAIDSITIICDMKNQSSSLLHLGQNLGESFENPNALARAVCGTAIAKTGLVHSYIVHERTNQGVVVIGVN